MLITTEASREARSRCRGNKGTVVFAGEMKIENGLAKRYLRCGKCQTYIVHISQGIQEDYWRMMRDLMGRIDLCEDCKNK